MNDSDSGARSRVWVVGVSGSGKSTFGRLLAGRLGVEHVELDALFWLPDWKMRSDEDFAAVVAEALDSSSWVVDGQYPTAVERFMPVVDCVVWLDPPVWLSYPRLARRTLSRLFRRTRFCGENYESVSSVFGRKSMLWLAARYHQDQRRKIRALIDLHRGPETVLIHHRHGELAALVEDTVERLAARETSG
ncbi:hypothetical protein [Kutzneria sp. CA-103260]|uniref:hypothetical protein n=1 Tax=Kutzneria sp. CA-103260 TaxID=2802641 RepID=UPI001BA901AE|nr:hypothetical protein [Kutzneria sp. CA-103260]QUQ65334.1 Shikimate kinase [Kutzneria sp. CA-103260]